MVQADGDLFSLIDTLLDEEASPEVSFSDSYQAEAVTPDTRATQCGIGSPAEQMQTADTFAPGSVQLEAMGSGSTSSRQSSMDAQTVRFAMPDAEMDCTLSTKFDQAESSPEQVSAWLQPAAASPSDRAQATCVCLAEAPRCVLLQRSQGASLGARSSGVDSRGLAAALASPPPPPPATVTTFGMPAGPKSMHVRASSGGGAGSLQSGSPPATAMRSRRAARADLAKAAGGVGNKKQKQEAKEAMVAPAAPAQKRIGRPLSFQGDPQQTTGLTKEELRRLRRRRSNRESAQRVRQRNAEAIESAEQQLTAMRREQQELQRRLASAEAAAACMQAKLRATAAKYVQEARRGEALRASLSAARASPRIRDGPQSPPPLLPPPLLQQQEGTPLPSAAATSAAFWCGADTPQLLPYSAVEWQQLQGVGGWPHN